VCVAELVAACFAACDAVCVSHDTYITFYTEIATTPKIHHIENLRFLGISRYKFKLRFWFESEFVPSWIWWILGEWYFQRNLSYRVAKTHRIPYLYRSFSAKVTYI